MRILLLLVCLQLRANAEEWLDDLVDDPCVLTSRCCSKKVEGVYLLSQDCQKQTGNVDYGSSVKTQFSDGSHRLPSHRVNGALTIIGTGLRRPIIYGAETYGPLFEVLPGASVVLRNLEFRGITQNSGVVPWGGSVFQFAQRGALSSLLVEDCTFKECGSKTSGGVLGVGIGLYNTQNGVVIDTAGPMNAIFRRCEFVDNSATENGGVFEVSHSYKSNLVVEDSFFSNNLATNGGVIYNSDAARYYSPSNEQLDLDNHINVKMERNIFSKNRATMQGGVGMFNNNGVIEVNGNIFAQNLATAYWIFFFRCYGNSIINGGQQYGNCLNPSSRRSVIKMHDNRVGSKDNQPIPSGKFRWQLGHRQENDFQDSTTPITTSCSTNTAVYQVDNPPDLSKDVQYGGYSCLTSTDVAMPGAKNIKQVTLDFSYKAVLSGTAGYALLIAALTPVADPKEWKLKINLSADLFSTGSTNNDVVLPLTLGIGCVSDLTRNLLCASRMFKSTQELHIVGQPELTTIRIGSKNRMFAVHGPQSSLHLQNLRLVDGSNLFVSNAEQMRGAANNVQGGGSVLVEFGSAFRLEHTLIQSSLSTGAGGGGGILAGGSGTKLYLLASNFTNNTVLGMNDGKNGGAVSVVEGAQGFVDDCVFTRNAAKGGHGGGLSALSSGTVVRVNRSTFLQNEAQSGGEGGAVFLDGIKGSESYIQHTMFQSNTAHENGGSISVVGSSLGELSSSSLLDNTAANGNGGGASFNGAMSKLYSLVVRGNTALKGEGGGISLRKSPVVFMVGEAGHQKDSDISFNKAKLGGGVSFVESGAEINRESLTLTSNTAVVQGGAAYFSASSLVIKQPMAPLIGNGNSAPLRNLFGYDTSSDIAPILECLPGTFDPNRLETDNSKKFILSDRICMDCPRGFYTSASYSPECSRVPTGRVPSSTVGASGTQECEKGTYSKGIECLQCPAGWVQAANASSECSVCLVSCFWFLLSFVLYDSFTKTNHSTPHSSFQLSIISFSLFIF